MLYLVLELFYCGHKISFGYICGDDNATRGVFSRDGIRATSLFYRSHGLKRHIVTIMQDNRQAF